MNVFRSGTSGLIAVSLVAAPFLFVVPAHADVAVPATCDASSTPGVYLIDVSPDPATSVATGTPVGFTATTCGFPDMVSYTVTDSFTGSGATPAGTIPGDGVFSWTPADADVGDHTFTVTATDSQNPAITATASQEVTVVSSDSSSDAATSANTATTTSDTTATTTSDTSTTTVPAQTTTSVATTSTPVAPGSTAFAPVADSTNLLVVSNPAHELSEVELLANAARLVTLQNANGSWDWIVTGDTGPTTNTYYNVTGVTAEGLLNAYEISHQTEFLTAAEKAGDYIISQNSPSPSAATRQNAYNIVFLYDLAAASGNETYKTEATTLLSSVFNSENYWSDNAGDACTVSGCTAAELLTADENYRSSPTTSPDGVVAWDLEPYVEAEVDAGNTTLAGQIQQQIQSYVTAPAYVSGIGDYSLGLSSAVRAAKAVSVDDSSDLAALKAIQASNGSLGTVSDGQIQATAYALLAFTEAGDTVDASSSAAFLGSSFGYADTSEYPAWKETDGNEYAENDDEADHALGTYIYVPNTFYSLDDAMLAATSGDTLSLGSGGYYFSVASLPANVTLTGTTGSYLELPSLLTGTTTEAQATSSILESTQAAQGTVSVAIPANTVFTSDAGWNSTLPIVTATTTSSVQVTGNTISVSEAVAAGTSADPITLSNSARIDFQGQGGKIAGIVQPNGVFSLISTTCASDTQAWADANLTAGSSCSVTSTSNLVVWTKQLATFVAYTETPINESGTSGSGGGSVSGGSGIITAASTGTVGSVGGSISGSGGEVLGASTYNFTSDLTVGSTGEDVTQLQTILIADGYLMIQQPTSYFGTLTKEGVIMYQKARGIPDTGFVGPLTLAALNEGTLPTAADEVASLKSRLSQLEAELAALTAATSTSTASTTTQ